MAPVPGLRAAGLATLGLSAPDTVVSPMSNRILSFADRGLTYAGLTVIMLYAGNLTEGELPRRGLAWLLGLVGIYAAVGGVGSMLIPKFGSRPRCRSCSRPACRTTRSSARP